MDAPFSIPFRVSASAGKLWIAQNASSFLGPSPSLASVDATPSGTAAATDPWSWLKLRGSNWAGFQNGGCVHELWRHDAEEYIAFLASHSINAVRLPLSAPLVNEPSFQITNNDCGPRYRGWETLAILDDVVAKLRTAGIFVTFGMHTLSKPAHNQGSWTDVPNGEQQLFEAWEKVALRYCSSAPNAIMADLFNEPHAATWSDWVDLAQRLGNRILQICPRWLIAVQGAKGGAGFQWGEKLIGQLTQPIQLSIPDRLVLTPHVYGHSWMRFDFLHADDFPENMPAIWDEHFGKIAHITGVPICVGEWGGVWNDTVGNGQSFGSTAIWQTAFASYLAARGFSSFYWTLNDNSFRTGSLFRDQYSAEKLALLETLPCSSILDLQEQWSRASPPGTPLDPMSPPTPSRPPPTPGEPPLLPPPPSSPGPSRPPISPVPKAPPKPPRAPSPLQPPQQPPPLQPPPKSPPSAPSTLAALQATAEHIPTPMLVGASVAILTIFMALLVRQARVCCIRWTPAQRTRASRESSSTHLRPDTKRSRTAPSESVAWISSDNHQHGSAPVSVQMVTTSHSAEAVSRVVARMEARRAAASSLEASVIATELSPDAHKRSACTVLNLD